MRTARKLSKLERALAVILALIWICGGLVALYATLIHSQWSLSLCALIAVAYGLAWTRVAVLSRLLTWPKLFTPWRSGKPW
jgi:hypothetical protein